MGVSALMIFISLPWWGSATLAERVWTSECEWEWVNKTEREGECMHVCVRVWMCIYTYMCRCLCVCVWQLFVWTCPCTVYVHVQYRVNLISVGIALRKRPVAAIYGNMAHSTSIGCVAKPLKRWKSDQLIAQLSRMHAQEDQYHEQVNQPKVRSFHHCSGAPFVTVPSVWSVCWPRLIGNAINQ